MGASRDSASSTSFNIPGLWPHGHDQQDARANDEAEETPNEEFFTVRVSKPPGASLGVTFQPDEDLDPEEEGLARLVYVSRGGLAERAGMRVGDIVVQINGYWLSSAREAALVLRESEGELVLLVLPGPEGSVEPGLEQQRTKICKPPAPTRSAAEYSLGGVSSLLAQEIWGRAPPPPITRCLVLL